MSLQFFSIHLASRNIFLQLWTSVALARKLRLISITALSLAKGKHFPEHLLKVLCLIVFFLPKLFLDFDVWSAEALAAEKRNIPWPASKITVAGKAPTKPFTCQKQSKCCPLLPSASACYTSSCQCMLALFHGNILNSIQSNCAECSVMQKKEDHMHFKFIRFNKT